MDLVLYELKVQLAMKVLMVFLVPAHLEQPCNQFELEEEVDTWVVAAVD